MLDDNEIMKAISDLDPEPISQNWEKLLLADIIEAVDEGVDEVEMIYARYGVIVERCNKLGADYRALREHVKEVERQNLVMSITLAGCCFAVIAGLAWRLMA